VAGKCGSDDGVASIGGSDGARQVVCGTQPEAEVAAVAFAH